MALNMRPTGLRSGIDKHRPDYTVCCGGWGGPDSLRWFWSMTVNGPMTRSNRVATLEEGAVSDELGRVQAWAKLEETE